MYPMDAQNSINLTSEDQRSLKVEYFVTNCVCQTIGEDQYPTYGILAKLSVDDKFEESSRIDDVSSSGEFVRKVIETLARNGVTPVTLKDVVEDIVVNQFDVAYI
jgi:orotate phosphoribosyltransferase-like protein